MSEVYVYQRTVLDALKIRKLWSFTFISPIVGHPVLVSTMKRIRKMLQPSLCCQTPLGIPEIPLSISAPGPPLAPSFHIPLQNQGKYNWPPGDKLNNKVRWPWRKKKLFLKETLNSIINSSNWILVFIHCFIQHSLYAAWFSYQNTKIFRNSKIQESLL